MENEESGLDVVISQLMYAENDFHVNGIGQIIMKVILRKHIKAKWYKLFRKEQFEWNAGFFAIEVGNNHRSRQETYVSYLDEIMQFKEHGEVHYNV